MPQITKIEHRPERQRYWVFVDGKFCHSVRERTFGAMDLTVGMEITCNEVKEREKFHWKRTYGPNSWERERERLNRVVDLIKNIDPRVEVRVVGFGAGSSELIPHHPEEAGSPDLEVVCCGNGTRLLMVEVSGTEFKRGDDYWVRPDKLEYASKHPDQDVWIVLHYSTPAETVIYIRPDLQRQYDVTNIEIRGATERYVIFSDGDEEVVDAGVFASHVLEKIEKFC